MSLILDAIKKSEKERQQQQVPTLNDNHIDYNELEHDQRNHMRIFLGVLLVITMLIISYFSYHYFSSQKSTYFNSKQVKKKPITQGKVAQPSFKKNASQQPPKKVLPSPSHADSKSSVVNITDNKTQKKSLQNSHTNHKTIINDQPPIVKTTLSTKNNRLNEVPFIENLPHNIQMEIPQIDYSSHVYTGSPDTSFVVFNSEILGVGDKFKSAITIENITANTVVLNFEGQNFKLKQLQSWPSR